MEGNGTQALPDALRMQEGLPLQEVEYRVAFARRLGGIAHRVIAFYLADMDRRGLHQAAGCCTVAQFAHARLAMSKREAQQLLAAGKALQDLRKIDEAFAGGALCWSKVRLLAGRIAPEHEQEWLKLALEVSCDELEHELRLARPGGPPRDRDSRKGLPDVRFRIDTGMGPRVFALWEKVRRKLQDQAQRPLGDAQCIEAAAELILSLADDGEAPGKRAGVGSPYQVVIQTCPHCRESAVRGEDGDMPVSDLEAEAITCDCGCQDLTDSDGKADRDVPAALRRRVLARDRHVCRVCGRRHRLQIHHIVFFSQGGATAAINLVTLCAGCHTLVHAGLLVITGRMPDGLRAVDPDGNDLLAGGAAEALLRRLEDRLPKLDHPAPVPMPAPVPVHPPATDEPELPQTIDGDWWQRHAHLIRWNDRLGAFEAKPGAALSLPAIRAHCAHRAHQDPANDAEQMKPPERAEPSACQRPAHLAELVGHTEVVASLQLAIGVARERGEPLGHCLLVGPGGTGKTTLARALASELGVRLHQTSGPMLRHPQTIASLLPRLCPREVLFIDEIHAMPQTVAETLYEAMEDRRLSLVLVNGSTHTLTMPLAPFTLIAATTDEGLLRASLIGRFEHREHLGFYDPAELSKLITDALAAEGLAIDAGAAAILARAAHGTAREAVHLARQARNQALAARTARTARTVRVDAPLARATLERLRIDGRGLGPVHRAILRTLRAHRGALSAARLSSLVGIARAALLSVYEPTLLRMGLVTVTPHGRLATG